MKIRGGHEKLIHQPRNLTREEHETTRIPVNPVVSLPKQRITFTHSSKISYGMDQREIKNAKYKQIIPQTSYMKLERVRNSQRHPRHPDRKFRDVFDYDKKIVREVHQSGKSSLRSHFPPSSGVGTGCSLGVTN